MQEIILVIVTTLISGLLASLVTIWHQRRSMIFDKKIKAFETLMSHRYWISSEESVSALNSIDVIFYKDKEVRDAYKAFLDETAKKPSSGSNMEENTLNCWKPCKRH